MKIIKRLLEDFLDILSLIILGSILFSCASKMPPIWRDQYGILHREEVTVNQVTQVIVLDNYGQVPGGCMRLNNIYISGTYKKDWTLKEETAKQFGTHVVKEYFNGVNDTLGIPWDCSNAVAIKTRLKLQKLYMRNQAMSELERRTYARGKNKVVKDSIPTIQLGD